jgi:hypothetical protein
MLSIVTTSMDIPFRPLFLVVLVHSCPPMLQFRQPVWCWATTPTTCSQAVETSKHKSWLMIAKEVCLSVFRWTKSSHFNLNIIVSLKSGNNTKKNTTKILLLAMKVLLRRTDGQRKYSENTAKNTTKILVCNGSKFNEQRNDIHLGVNVFINTEYLSLCTLSSNKYPNVQ